MDSGSWYLLRKTILFSGSTAHERGESDCNSCKNLGLPYGLHQGLQLIRHVVWLSGGGGGAQWVKLGVHIRLQPCLLPTASVTYWPWAKDLHIQCHQHVLAWGGELMWGDLAGPMERGICCKQMGTAAVGASPFGFWLCIQCHQ